MTHAGILKNIYKMLLSVGNAPGNQSKQEQRVTKSGKLH